MSMSLEECSVPRPGQPRPSIPSNVLQQFNLRDRVCIVTGGSRGIGLAVAEGFAEAGADVVIVHRSSTSTAAIAFKAADLSQRHGVSVSHACCDVTDAQAVTDLVARVRTERGRIDVFVANAGVYVPGGLLDRPLEEFQYQMAVNVLGVVHCARAVGPVFREQGSGNFIITTSICGSVVTVPTDHTAYNTSKGAAIHLGRSLAREWRAFARVNMVSPGWIETDMVEEGPDVNEARRMAVMGRLGTLQGSSKFMGMSKLIGKPFNRSCQRAKGGLSIPGERRQLLRHWNRNHGRRRLHSSLNKNRYLRSKHQTT